MPLLSQQTDHALDSEHSIFLSHSGFQKDFVERLCLELERLTYRPFFDRRSHSLPKGEKFPHRILEAATKCKVGVVVLSQEFLRSKWPMLELSTFVETSKNSSLKILPLFYKLSVRDLSDKNKIDEWRGLWEKFAAEDSRINVEKWCEALTALRSWNGLEFNQSAGELDYLNNIVSNICNLVGPHIRYDASDVCGKDRLCKEIIVRFEELSQSSHQDSNSKASVLGMYGLPGSGKSTLSKCLCDHFFPQFSGKVSYVELPPKPSSDDVIEKLKEVLRKLIAFRDIDPLVAVSDLRQARCLLKYHLPRTKVFLVIDNISNQANSLAAVDAILESGFGEGSKVMLVARSSDVLCSLKLRFHGQYIFYDPMPVPDINEDEAVSILLHSAVGLECKLSRFPAEKRAVIMDVVSRFRFRKAEEETYHFHPFTMERIGGLLRMYGKDLTKWKAKLDGSPVDEKKPMMSIIKMSYDELREDLKLVFLDVALFLSEWRSSEEWRSSQWKCVEDVCKWLSIVHKYDTATIMMKLEELKTYCFLWLNPSGSRLGIHELYADFAEFVVKENKTRYLYRGEEREGPPQSSAEERQTFRRIVLCDGGFEKADLQDYPRVEAVRMKGCKRLREVKLQGMTSLLSLDVEGCPKLRRVEGQSSLCNVKMLRWVQPSSSLEDEERQWRFYHWLLRDIPPALEVGQLRCLQILEMRGTGVKCLSALGNCLELRELHLQEHKLKEFPKLGKVTKLEHFFFCEFQPGKRIYRGRRKAMEAPDLSGCGELQKVIVDGSAFKTFPKLAKLTKLSEVRFCQNDFVTELPDLSTARQTLERLHLEECTGLIKVSSFDGFTSLTCLSFWSCAALVELPDLSGLINLHKLIVSNCDDLVELGCIGKLTKLERFSCTRCWALKEIPDLSGLINLETLDVSYCVNLAVIRGAIGNTIVSIMLRKCETLESLVVLKGTVRLREINMGGCQSLRRCPVDILQQRCLGWLEIAGCGFASEETLVRWVNEEWVNAAVRGASMRALAWQLRNQEVSKEERAALRDRLAAATIPLLVRDLSSRARDWDLGNSCLELLMCLCWDDGYPHEVSVSTMVHQLITLPTEVGHQSVLFTASEGQADLMYSVGLLAAVAATGRDLHIFSKLPKHLRRRRISSNFTLPCLMSYLAHTKPNVFATWDDSFFQEITAAVQSIIENFYEPWQSMAREHHLYRDYLIKCCLGHHFTKQFFIDTLHHLKSHNPLREFGGCTLSTYPPKMAGPA